MILSTSMVIKLSYSAIDVSSELPLLYKRNVLKHETWKLDDWILVFRMDLQGGRLWILW